MSWGETWEWSGGNGKMETSVGSLVLRKISAGFYFILKSLCNCLPYKTAPSAAGSSWCLVQRAWSWDIRAKTRPQAMQQAALLDKHACWSLRPGEYRCLELNNSLLLPHNTFSVPDCFQSLFPAWGRSASWQVFMAWHRMPQQSDVRQWSPGGLC